VKLREVFKKEKTTLIRSGRFNESHHSAQTPSDEKKSISQSAPARRSLAQRPVGEGGFFDLRVLIASVFCLVGVFIALTGPRLYLGSSKAQAQPGPGSAPLASVNSPAGRDVVQLVGPVALNKDLRSLLGFRQLRRF
jgi:hypothetical protein